MKRQEPLATTEAAFWGASKWVLLLAALIWFGAPLLTAGHIEAFSGGLQSTAIQLHLHGSAGLELVNQGSSIVTEFLFLTRGGLILLLAALMDMTGTLGDGVFRAIMLTGLGLFAVASVGVARRWSDVRLYPLLVMVVLTPGILESGFSFSDNLPSAALVMLSLWCIERQGTSLPRWLVVGVLFGAGCLVRMDALLVLPGVLVGLVADRPRLSRLAMRILCVATGIGAVVLAMQMLTPYNLRDSLKISTLFVGVQKDLIFTHHQMAYVALSFFGPISALLVLLGAWRNTLRKSWRWSICWGVLPGLFLVYALTHAQEPRVLYLLCVPAVLIQGATGLEVAQEGLRSGRNLRLSAAAAVSIFLFTFALPPYLQFFDGPRAIVGRLWSPLLWFEWQRTTLMDIRQLDRLVESVGPGQTLLVVSAHYNPEHYLRLRLYQHGFTVEPAADRPGPCRFATEIFRKGDSTVVHVRSDDPYQYVRGVTGASRDRISAMQVADGLECAQNQHPTRAVMLSWLEMLPYFYPATHERLGDDRLRQVVYPERGPALHRVVDGRLQISELTAADRETLLSDAKTAAARSSEATLDGKPLDTYADFHNRISWHYWTPTGPVGSVR